MAVRLIVSNRKFIETIAGLMNKTDNAGSEFILKIVVGEFAKNLCTGQKSPNLRLP
ncbi:MAG: hypothetical protein R3A12_06690 [Ignavibacteria bacterium]